MTLPAAVERYWSLAAPVDRGPAEAIAACFTSDAEVGDEDQTWRGHDGIREWWDGPAKAFEYTLEATGTQSLDDGRIAVFGRIEGNFPGGIADLAYRFTIRDGLIGGLEISPPRPGEGAGRGHRLRSVGMPPLAAGSADQ